MIVRMVMIMMVPLGVVMAVIMAMAVVVIVVVARMIIQGLFTRFSDPDLVSGGAASACVAHRLVLFIQQE